MVLLKASHSTKNDLLLVYAQHILEQVFVLGVNGLRGREDKMKDRRGGKQRASHLAKGRGQRGRLGNDLASAQFELLFVITAPNANQALYFFFKS